MKRILLLAVTLLAVLVMTAPAQVFAKSKQLTPRQIANRARNAAEKAKEKAEIVAERLRKEERRRINAEKRARLRSESRVSGHHDDDDTDENDRGELSSNRRGEAITGTIRVTNLDYSCWRWQSDAQYPVFIEKHKPFVDLEAKVDRCFTGRERDGYEDPEFTVTYTVDGKSQKFTAETSRKSWTDISPGCYNATLSDDGEDLSGFRSVSCP